jgi:predicted nucleic acid-binding protein
MIVLDASIVADMILDTPRGAQAVARIAEEADDELPELFAPHLLDAEVAQVLRRFVLQGELREARAHVALDDLERLPVVRHAHRDLIRRAWQLRHNATIYDALYVALAEQLDALLITGDRGLAQIPQTRARVVWLENRPPKSG